MVLLRNVSDELFSYAQGDRVAQLLIVPVATPEILITDTELDKMLHDPTRCYTIS